MMTQNLYSFLWLLSLHKVTDAMFGGYVMERSVAMNGNGCADVQWTVDREAKEITFGVRSVPGASWVAIGISENGGMKGADIAMVRNIDDEFVVDDLFSTEMDMPRMDILQNVEMLHAEVDSEDRLSVVLRRPLETCDADDIAVSGTKQNIICASGIVNDQGKPMFHGLQRSKALVNLVTDEHLLIERSFDLNFTSSNIHLVDETVVAHQDPETAKSPFAVDFQMPHLQDLDQNERTHYRCLVVTMPIDMNIIAFESVWNNGTTIEDEQAPSWLHHQNIRYCPQPELIDPIHMNGQAFDCYENLPPCEDHVGHAQNGRLQTPAGVHLPLNKGGTYLLTVHYDNPYNMPLENDSSGIRIWIDPPSVDASSKPGQITYLRANFDSIEIPADPEEKEYELQFMISSEATKAVLPPEGIQVFATHAHMHGAGARAQAKLIRNGVHISNVYDSKGYDFALQAPQWNLWRLMPGDAIIMSCFYKPHPTNTITGGWNTEDEMCNLIFGLAPFVESFNYGVGWMVRPDEPFRNSFMGTASVGTPMTTGYSQAIYLPNTEGRNYVPLEDHRSPNFCDLVIRDKVAAAKVIWSSPEIPAQMYIILAFGLVSLLPLLFRQLQMEGGERKRRNTIVYIVQLLFSTVALPVIAWSLADLGMDPKSSYDVVDPDTYALARGLIVAQSMLYLLELFYRIRIRTELVIHHLLAAILVIFLNWVNIETMAFYTVFKLGLVLTLMAVTEQPMYIALIAKSLGYDSRGWWPKLCRFAAWSFLIFKLLLVAMAIVIMIQGHTQSEASFQIAAHSFKDWYHTSNAKISSTILLIIMSIALVPLLASQVYVARLLLRMAKAQEHRLKALDATEVTHGVTTGEQERSEPTVHISTAFTGSSRQLDQELDFASQSGEMFESQSYDA